MADRLTEWAAWLAANPFTKALAVLIAVTAWLFVQQDVAREAAVPVRLHWETPDGLVSTEPLRGQIHLRVEGPRAATKRVRGAQLTKEIDLGPLPPGEHVIDLTDLDWSDVAEQVRLVGVEPPSLTVELDELVEQKVDVEVRQVGVPPGAYAVRGISVEPGVVVVRGPRKVVSRLGRVPTKPLDVSEVTRPTEVDAPLDLPRGVEVEGDVPRATIDVVAVERTIEDLEVPVVVRGAAGYQVEPQQLKVSLRGPAPYLEWIDADNVLAFVRMDEEGLASAEARYGPKRGPRLEIWHPGGPEVTVTRVQPPQVRVERR